MKDTIRATLIKRSFLFPIFFCIAVATYSGPLWAGGLYLEEFSTPSMGVASAGAEAVCMDASTAFHNPAGMTRLKGNEFMLSGGLFMGTAEFDPDSSTTTGGGDGGDAAGYAPLLGAFYVRSLSEDWKLGVNLISISGAALDYGDNWAGRYQCQNVSITTLTLSPTIAYRVNDWLSVAGGVNLMYGNLELELAVPTPGLGDGQAKLDGDDIDVGFNLAFLLEPSNRTRFGVMYWSKLEPEFSGDLDFKRLPSVGTDTDLTFPQFIRAGVYHELNDKWALLGTVAWEDWSKMDNLLISTNAITATIPRNWDDTWHFACGAHYRMDDQWLLQGGIAYDTNPVDSKDRTADMPIDRQVRVTLGVQKKIDEKKTYGFALEYLDFGKGKIKSSGPAGTFNGEFDNNWALLLAFNVNWK
jgi:long-chain fatty acid transport protein